MPNLKPEENGLNLPLRVWFLVFAKLLHDGGDNSFAQTFGNTAQAGTDMYTIFMGIPQIIRQEAPDWYASLTDNAPERDYIMVIRSHNHSRVKTSIDQLGGFERAYGKAVGAVNRLERQLEERKAQQEAAAKNGGEYNEAYILATERDLEAATEERDAALSAYNDAAAIVESGATSYIPLTRKTVEEIGLYGLDQAMQVLTLPNLPVQRLPRAKADHADL
jgi:hypothetical protein